VERVAELLGTPPPRRGRRFEQLLQSRSGGVDLATGTAGMVAVVARHTNERPAWLPALGEVLRKAQAAGLPPLPYPDGELPAYLPNAPSGVRFALARLDGRAPAAADDPGRRDVGDPDLLVSRYLASGTWFPGSGLADRLNLGGMLGVGAVALTLLRKAFPEGAIPSLWRLD
jgi:hypothetical protein